MTEDICYVDNGFILRVVALGGSDVCLDAINFLERPLSRGNVSTSQAKGDKIR